MEYEPFSIVALSVLPNSFLHLMWLLLGLKRPLLWKNAFRNDAHGPQLCFPVVRGPSPQRSLKSRTPMSPLCWNSSSSLPHPWQSPRQRISVGRWPYSSRPAPLGYVTSPAIASLEISVLPQWAVGNICPSGCTDSFSKVLKQDLLVSPDLTACQQNDSMLIYSVMMDKDVFCWFVVPQGIMDAGVLHQEHETFYKVRIKMKD